jgi:hypothetical protein
MSEKVQELVKLLRGQRDRARTLGALRLHPGEHEFILSGREGALHVHLRQTGVRVSLHTKEGRPKEVIFTRGEIPRNLKYSEFEFLIDSSKNMEVAPLARMPYGIVNDGAIVGICFTTDATKRKSKSRDQLGFIPDLYVVAAPKWLSVPTPDLATWLGRFWTEYEAKRVIDLSPRFMRFVPAIHAYAKGTQNWLVCDGSDGKKPLICAGEHYVLWDHATGCLAQKERQGRSHGFLNQWLIYS